MRAIRAILLGVVFALSACAQLGLAPAETFEDKLAYAYGANTALREASTSALNAGTISSEDMATVILLNTQVRLGLDAAKTAKSLGDLKTAEAKLQLATGVLTQLQTYLRSRGVKTAFTGELSWA